MGSCHISGACKFYLVSIYHGDTIQILLKILCITILIFNITYNFGDAKLYHFDNKSGNLDSNWRSNSLLNWKVIHDQYHSKNYFLTTNLSSGRRYLSIGVDGDGSSALTFEWEKIGGNAKLIFYFDNITDENNITTCGYCNDLGQGGPITIPSGHHTATWDFIVDPSSGSGIGESQAWLDNINIPEICVSKPDCTIMAPSKVCINSTNEASVPYQSDAIFHWNIEGGVAISGTDSNVLTWRAGDFGKVKIEAIVSKSGCKISNFTNVFIEPFCISASPTSIHSIMSKYQNKIRILHLFNSISNDTLELNNIRNIVIDSNSALDSGFNCSNNPGIKLIDCVNITIMNLSLSSNKCGIDLNNCHNCKIWGNYVNCYNGPEIYLNNSSNNYIEYNQIQQSKIGNINETGIQLSNSNDNTIFKNKINMLGNYEAYWLDGSKYNKITISDCGAIHCSDNIFYSLYNKSGNLTFVNRNGIDLGDSIIFNLNTWKCITHA